MIIEVEGLHHTYLAGTPFEARVLHGVDLSVAEGELVGLVGPAQSGKSTFMQYLNGLYLPKRGTGSVRVCGIDTAAKDVDLRTLRQQVGMVFQYPEYQLFAETVGADVAYGPKNLGLEPDEVERRVEAALQAVHLEPSVYADRDVFALSGGEKRRAAIAGVLALDPRVLVLDDPLAGLDPRGRQDVLAWLRGLHEEEGLTILVASNSLSDIAPLLQRVAVMVEGRVVANGAPSEIFTDVDLLRRAGLGVLPTVELMMRLREAGYDVPLNVLTAEQAADVVAEAMSGWGTSRSEARGAR